LLDDPLLVAATLLACVVLAELLVRHTPLRHGGTALVVIVVTAVVANLGVIPAGSTPEHPVAIYDAVFGWLAPLAIFWLVLRVDLRRALSVGWPLLASFGLGVTGTALGVWAGLSVVGVDVIGDKAHAIAGMFAATYTGGSANFNAVALHYDVVQEGTLYAGAVAVDSGLTAVWMVITIAVPRWLRGPRPATEVTEPAEHPEPPGDPDEESTGPYDLALLGALGVVALWAATAIAQALAGYGLALPMMLVLTAIGLALGQLRWVSRLRGMNLLGMFAVYLFLAVIGAFCDLSALAALGRLGVDLMIFASVLLLVHGVVTLGGAHALRFDPDVAAVASQANIGGGSTALALARSLGRPDLVLPAILIGSLGTAAGTFVGFFVAAQLAP